MAVAPLTAKGQIVIPAEIRARHELTPGTQGMRGFYELLPREFCRAVEHLLGMAHVTVERWQAVSDALVCLCPTRDVDGALGAVGATALEMVRMQAQALARVERVAEARSRARTAARVGALLVALSETLSPPRRLAVIPPGLQQRDLGALLALRHESVCRALVRLERDGFVARSADGIRLRDREGLAAL